MNEADEQKGVFDVNTVDQGTTTFVVEVNYAEVCRLCMGTESGGASTATTVFAIYEDSTQYRHLAMALANVKIDENDPLPKKLCDACREHLIHFYAFKRKCEKTDRALNEIFQTNNEKQELEGSHSIEMCTTLIDGNHFDGDVAFGLYHEKDMLGSDCVAATIANKVIERKSETKKKKRKRPSKRIDVMPSKLRVLAKEKTRKVCEQCGLTFSSNCTLRRHRITHTGRKDFICDICQNRFARKFHLDMHMRIHLKIRPHICETCASTFSTSSDLSRHRRIHVDVKNYACVVCERRFKRSSDVIKHMRSHTGQKPYACGTGNCDKKYSSHSGLSKHLRRHHPQLVVQRVTEINEKKAKEQEIIEQKKYAGDAMCPSDYVPVVTTLPVSVP